MTALTESFTGTPLDDLDTSANWTKVRDGTGDLLYSGGGDAVYGGAATTTSTIYKNDTLSQSAQDCECSATLTTFGWVANQTNAQLVLRLTDLDNYYYADFIKSATDDYVCYLRKRVAGTISNIGTASSAGVFDGNDTLKFRVTGTGASTTLTAYVNDVQVVTATDSAGSFSSGALGIGFYMNSGNAIEYTSWTGNDAFASTLRLTAHESAAGVTDVAGVVFAAPTTGLTGARIGEFTGATFEASLDGGLAVLKVALADFGGESLTTADTPVVALQHPVLGTGLVSCTVVTD